MRAKDPRAPLLEEQQRRGAAEAKLARALENNGALARSNLRLQEQLARLRGESDVRQHEAGCLRAAAAAREAEAAIKVTRLQHQLQRGAAERLALERQLAGKQEVIAYLESKLGGQQTQLPAAAAPAEGAATDAGAGDAGAGSAQPAVVAAPSCSSNAAAVAPEVPAARDGGAATPACQVSEGGTADSPSGSLGLETSSDGSPAEDAAAEGLLWLGGDKEAGANKPASSSPDAEQQAQEAQQAAETPVQATPAGQRAPAQPPATAAGGPLRSVLRSSMRARAQVSYAEPALNSKLRQGDRFTFGSAEAAAAVAGGRSGGGGGHGERQRARTKPRPRHATALVLGRLLTPLADG